MVSDNKEVDLTIGETMQEAEDLIPMNRDNSLEEEGMVEATDMTRIMNSTGMITKEVEAVVHSVDPGEVVVIIIHKDGDTHHLKPVIHNIKGSHSINTSVASVTIENIMTISVILCNIYFMLCNYKMGRLLHKQTWNMTVRIKLINRLFRRGIPQP